jgi:hypothetical protein
MNKGLKEIKRLPNAIKDTFKDSFDIIKKELKALETLKDLIGVIEIDQYNKKPPRYELRMCGKLVFYIKENEYQTLKEVLPFEEVML